MPRLFKALSLTLAFAALIILSVVAASCGSSGTSYRVINAIANYGVNFDITLNGATVFTNVAFTNIEPSGNDGYQSVGSGGNTMEVFPTGGTTGTPVINSALSFSGGSQFTVVLMGNSGASGSKYAYAAQPFTDNNVAPVSGDFEFRVIDASTNLPANVDIYIVGAVSVVTGQNPPAPNATLAFGQPSTYQSNAAGTWYLVVTNKGGHIPLFSYPYTPSALQIRTLVLVDGQNGFGYSPTPLEFDDLN